MNTEETMQSQTIGKIAEALAKAQAKFDNARKSATNPHLKSKYADLASVREAVSKPLAEQGIAVVQTMEPHGAAGVCVVTTMMHSSGEWIRGRCFLPVPEGKNPAQAFGSALTYARRYSLAAICGIAADEDDDGASVAPTTKAPSSSPQPVDDGVQKARKAIAEAKTVAELEAVGVRLNKSSKDVRDAVMGDFAEKLAALKGQVA